MRGWRKRDERLPFARAAPTSPVARHLDLRDRIGPGEGVLRRSGRPPPRTRVEETGLERRRRTRRGPRRRPPRAACRIGHECHSPLARSGLLGDADLHAERSLSPAVDEWLGSARDRLAEATGGAPRGSALADRGRRASRACPDRGTRERRADQRAFALLPRWPRARADGRGTRGARRRHGRQKRFVAR